MRTRRRFTADFKVKVALGATKGHQTVGWVGDQARAAPHPDCSPEARGDRKAAKIFDDKGAEVQANCDAEVTKLHAMIGQLVVERDFLAQASIAEPGLAEGDDRT